MAFDAALVMAVVDELNNQLLPARIDRVFQPEREEVHLLLRQPGQTYRLLISAQVNQARLHLTEQSKSNPAQPPLFCMVLRKHLEGGRLIRIVQPPLERIVYLHIQALNELGDKTEKILACEIMGRHSNIILYDAATKVIIDGIKRYTHALSRHREVLPGRPYIPPPAQNKTNLFTLKMEELPEVIWKDNWEQTVNRALLSNLAGLSPVLARELVYRAGLKEHTLIEACGEYELARLGQELTAYREALRQPAYQPTLIAKEKETFAQWEADPRPLKSDQEEQNAPVNRQDARIQYWLAHPRSIELIDYGALPLYHLIQSPRIAYSFEKANQLIDVYFQVKQQQVRWQEKKQALKKALESQLERAYRKSSLREESWSQIQSAEKYRLYGELLMTYLYQIKPGFTEITVVNLYEEEETLITIPLLPELSGTENAQRYFKKYQRARRSLQIVKDQFKLAQEEIAYLESVNQAVEHAFTLEDLQEIRFELIEQGYLRPLTPEEHVVHEAAKARLSPDAAFTGKKKKKSPHPGRTPKRKPRLPTKKTKNPVQPMCFRSTDGLEILVGKNNKQNDYLTLKVARKNDVWLHVKEIPGSHVLIRAQSEPIPQKTLEEAANLAAYFSKARYSSRVPVDYTLRQYVRKPTRAKPGYVIYDHHQTLYVTPDQENLKSLIP